LQEFWVGNEELVNLYEKRLGDAGYVSFKLGRTNNRGDGMIIYYAHSLSIPMNSLSIFTISFVGISSSSLLCCLMILNG